MDDKIYVKGLLFELLVPNVDQDFLKDVPGFDHVVSGLFEMALLKLKGSSQHDILG